MLQPRHLAPLALLLAVPLGAQTPAKRPITQDVYDAWRTIGPSLGRPEAGTAVSPDGRWIAYTLTPVVGDGELVVRSTGAATEFRVPRGYTGRPALTTSRENFSVPTPRITADSRWVAALTYAPQAEYEKARRAKKRGAEPKASLALMSLPEGRVTTVPRVKSFAIAERGARFVAYLLEAPDSTVRAAGDSAAAPTGAVAAVPGGEPRPVADSAGRAKKRTTGTTLVVRDLAQGGEQRVDGVMEYAFSRDGAWLAYAVAAEDSARDGVYLREVASGREVAVATGPGRYKQLVWDEPGTQVAFVSDREVRADSAKRRFALYQATVRQPQARRLVAADAFGMAERVADGADVAFVRNGQALTFGIQPVPPDSIPADSLADKAVLDLWHWKDDRLQPQQRLEAARDRNRAYTAIYQLRPNRVVRLANDSLPSVRVSEDGRLALAVTDAPYAVERMWGEDRNDVYLIDATTGAIRPVARALDFGAELSPDGKYVAWFTDGRWHAYDVATGRTTDLTGSVASVRFDRETWDTPSTAPAWGSAGWTEGDQRLLVYDRYDLWALDPSGRTAPRVVTDSAGRRARTELRLVRLDREERPLAPSAPLLLSATHDSTKASGFWRDRLGAAAPPERIVMADARFGSPLKADSTDVYVVSRQTVQDFPDLYAGRSLASLTRLTDANPQQGEYPWPSVELVEWRSDDGIPLQGLLYKPEGFDPSKQYPMLVYFYEKLSDNLHGYVAPAGRNTINPVTYTSKGYLVFMPDIVYQDGYPGQSAYNSIVPGVQKLLARGYVKPDGIGLGGQSWGGYQTAYLITRSNLFNAAFAGAPVANMTSAYGGIRWGSGLARAFQYEKTQSRIGGSIWEYPLRYLENSPLFAADKIETPVLIMHNDEDGAVPWYQGIELFVALRRLGKEAYLVNYNGDDHNPIKRANQKDIDLRMQQFFDHHLTAAPAPQWMTDGIPFLRKGRPESPIAAEATAASPAVPAGEAGAPPR